MKRKTIVYCVFSVFIFTILSFSVLADTSKISVRMVNQDPDPATSGDVVELRLAVENRDDKAVDNLVMEIVPEYPYEPVSGELIQKKVPTIGAFQVDDNNQIVKYKIRINRDATAGEYELKVNYWELGKESTKKQTTLSVDVESQKNAEVIYIDKFEIVPGQITPMTFTINNVGSAPLRELTFHWENEEGVVLPVGSDDTRYIKYIDVGDKEDLIYDVIASSNADPDLYKLKLTLTYDDPLSQEKQTIETAAGVYVGGETDFDIAYSGTTKGETAFSVSNIGSVPASSVTVKIPSQDNWRVSGTNAVIIGNLNKGDYTVASFNLEPSRSRGETEERQRNTENKNVEVQIEYTDTRGERHTVKKEVFVDLSSARSAESEEAPQRGNRGNADNSSSFFRNIVIIIIISGVLYFTYKKFKKKKKPSHHTSD